MKRQFHLLTIFDTYALRMSRDGIITSDRLIGYEPPAAFSEAIHCLNKSIGQEIIKQKQQQAFEVVHPSDEQYRAATKTEQAQWLRHILSNGKTPPPTGVSEKELSQHNSQYHQDDIRDFKRALESYKQYRMAQQIVSLLVEWQQEHLRTGNWIDKRKITLQQLASAVELYSEPTIRRAVKSLNFKLNGNIFPASSLLCKSIRPFICKQIINVSKNSPDLGAPALTDILNQELGVIVSRRSVGLALDMLRERSLV